MFAAVYLPFYHLAASAVAAQSSKNQNVIANIWDEGRWQRFYTSAAVSGFVFFCFSPFYAVHSCPLSPLIDVRTLRCISALQDAPTLVCIWLLHTRRPASPTSCKIQAARIDCAAHRGRRVFFSDWLPQLRTILAAVGRKWNLNFFLVYGSIGNKIDFRGLRGKKNCAGKRFEK